jgi:hypothetical protein
MPKQIATSAKEAIWKLERQCKRWREDVEYNENKSRQAVVRVLRELRNIALEATGCTKRLCLRGGGRRTTIAENLVRLFNLKTRECSFACIPYASWKGLTFRRKVVQKENECCFQFPPPPPPASVSISDINKTDFFLYFGTLR